MTFPPSSTALDMPTLDVPGSVHPDLADRILLVDDDAGVRAAMRRVLAQAGLLVTEADNGDQAALLLDRPGAFDMLVTDVRMPGMRDGLSLATDWRARAPGRPLLFVTGSSDKLRLDQLGPQEAVICKPFPRASLVDAVRRMLRAAP
jgi:CheY-like chemotaxis protein